MKKWSFSIAFFIFMMVVIVTESRAVEYELPDTNGKIHSLEQYKGQWLIVNYWATWCALCMEEMPELIDFHKNNAVGAAVVGINFEEIDAEKLKAFVREKTIPYTVLSTLPIKKTPIGLVPALPTTYIIDPEGNVVAGEVGMVTSEDLEAYIVQKNIVQKES